MRVDVHGVDPSARRTEKGGVAGESAVVPASEQHDACVRAQRFENRLLDGRVHFFDRAELRGCVAQIVQRNPLELPAVAGRQPREVPAKLGGPLRGACPSSSVDHGPVVGMTDQCDERPGRR